MNVLVQNCTKIWIFERSPGATLVGNDKKTLPTVVTRQQCQQSCLDETSFDCRSAKFTLGHRNGSEIVGRCVLSDTDRHVMTSSFRVSRSDEEYFDNQCSKSKFQILSFFRPPCIYSHVIICIYRFKRDILPVRRIRQHHPITFRRPTRE